MVNPTLYKIMRDVYNTYTGREVAEVVAQIRKEIEQEQEKLRIQNEINTLTDRLDQLK